MTIDLTDINLIKQDEQDLIDGKKEWHEYCIQEEIEEESEDCTYIHMTDSDEFSSDDLSLGDI